MIKNSFTLILLFITVAGVCQNTRAIDVQHYIFSIALSDASDTINCEATIRIKFTEATDRFTLDLSSVKRGKGMTVQAVKEKEKLLETVHRHDTLLIKLPGKVQAGDSSTFIIRYKGIPADGLIISQNRYGHRTFFADNWPNRGHNWIACNDDPADKASVEFIVTAPQHYQIIANGIQVEETNLDNNRKLTHWKEDVPAATKVMVIGAAGFAVNLSGFVGCIPVYSWVYPEDKRNGFYDYAQANEILPFFINHVGPYGYKKLANVESKTIFGGLENANTIFYSESSITGTRKEEDLLTHEIAHQWFGDMVTEKSYAHLWLSEGFATYFTTLYFENKYGLETAVNMEKKDRRDIIAFSKEDNSPVVDTAEKDYMKLLTVNNYQKGGWVLHMLRCETGDSVFWKSIREYYAEYAGKNADSHDLQVIFEKNSGKNLNSFFRQWLYTAGQPSLSIVWKTDKDSKLLLKISQLQNKLFSFPLEIALKDATGKTTLEKLAISKKDETFSINTASPIVDILADPNTHLLFEEKNIRAN